jgi:hypothetical protein
MPFMLSSGPIPAPDLGFPDVCKTPTPVGPIPIPYPNMQMAIAAIPAQLRHFLCFMPTHNLVTTKPLSLGDQPGVAMGIVSQMVMGPIRHLLGSFRHFIGGPPVTKSFMNPTGHNGAGPNVPGLTLAPSQVRSISLT